MTTAFQPPIVILANGRFPSHPYPLQILKKAGTVICTDGSADKLLEFDLTPHVIIGDQDSTSLNELSYRGLWIKTPNQDKTDLHKALEWCLVNGLKEIVVLGAMGEREDHALSNLHLLGTFSKKMTINYITDYANIYTFTGKRTFPSIKGQQISIVAIEPVKSITTTGLKYVLHSESFPPDSTGISNEAEGDEFSVATSHPVWLFINHPE